MNRVPQYLAVIGCVLLASPIYLLGDSPTPPSPWQLEFFESRIRPVLVQHCYSCHNSSQPAEGGLVLDHRRALADGGDSGPVIVPGRPQASRLIAVIQHQIDGLEMPDGGPKLDDQVIADFERWIAIGAPDPRHLPPAAGELPSATTWATTLQQRKRWWSLQPIKDPDVPGTAGHPIDRFIGARIDELGLSPSPRADKHTLIRRLFINLIGLPPTPTEAWAWSHQLDVAGEDASSVIERLIDGLLARNHFGERWARHWMDWIRYAESHGSEGDPEIVGAWRYRDYLIRALNSDVPYDQLVREHIAGDLLSQPRLNESLGINESMIGPAHWRMVFHGFAPTDALDEKVRFIDDQVDAFSKAFLGLTVSCARCHDHKFDAISQQDYYALFGILASCRPGRSVIDLPDRQNRNREALVKLKARIRKAVAQDWLDSLDGITAKLDTAVTGAKDAGNAETVLTPLLRLRQRRVGELAQGWRELVKQWRDDQKIVDESSAIESWDLSNPEDYSAWYRRGTGLPNVPEAPGGFAIRAGGDLALTDLYPAGVYTHALSAKHPGRLTSRDFEVNEDSEVWIRTLGDSGASVRYVVQDYPRRGTVYPVKNLKPSWTWHRFDLAYWKGDSVHVELATAKDAPLLVGDRDRSWFGVTDVRIVKKGGPPPQPTREFFGALIDAAQASPNALGDVAKIYVTAIGDAIRDWESDSATDAQADLLSGCLRAGLLPNDLASLAGTAPLVAEYRELEDEIPLPTRVPGLDETFGRTQPLFIRGSHKRPGELVPRRFLEAIDRTPYETSDSGRLRLAEDLIRSDNPLTRRVVVNRVWHHLFGRGIVSTPDNFGRVGSQPTHPQLLDWLACRLVDDGWSLKKLIRLIVTSRTWQQSSEPSERAMQLDPENLYLSHANLRRMEAEAVRDSMLAACGRLQRTLYGPPVGGTSNRRSVYVAVIRNSLDPLLRAFDFPEPSRAIGRRDVTNVPAQSLTMMNAPQVAQCASSLASQILKNHQLNSDQHRLNRTFLALVSRMPSSQESQTAIDYLASTKELLGEQQRRVTELRAKVDERRLSVSAILDPAWARLAGQAKTESDVENRPRPIAMWDFDQESSNDVVSRSKLLAALSDQNRKEVESAWKQIAELEAQIQSLSRVPGESVDHQAWTDLVQALLTLKEFIYVR